MARSILIYNMPEDIKEFLKIESEKHDFEIIECDDNDLSTKISVLLKEEDGEQIQSDEEGVDINFLMINKFNNQILHRFIKDMQREDIYIPNKCVTTQHNINWSLKQLMLENKEEHEVMTIYKQLAVLRTQAIQLYKKINDDELYDTINEVTEYMHPKDFDKDELIRRFNHLQSVMERISQQAGSFLFDNKFLVCYIYNTV